MLGPLFRNSFRDFRPFRDFVPRHQFYLIGIAVIVGLAVGYAAILFRLALSGMQFVFFGETSEYLVASVQALPWWHVVLAPAVGGVILSLFLRYLMPGGRPQGVPDVIEAGVYNEGRMSFRTGLGAAVASVISIGAGASTGREGPLVHLGGAISGSVGKLLKMDRLDGHTLLACGVATGVAASFNAPIAGVIFAHEVVLGHYALRALAPVVVASVIGTVVTRIHIGDFPAFLIPHYDILSFWEFPAFMLLGIVCGIMALIFFWSVGFTRDVIEDVLKIPVFWRPPIAGLAVGAIALLYPEVLGVGYEATDNALKQLYPLSLLILLVAAKMAATSITIAGGFGGGVFSPALFIGAMTGGAFGLIAAHIFPELAAEHGLYAMVGMGAVAAAILGAPISTTLIVFELTGDYRVTIALMVGVVLATVVSRQFRYISFFHWQLARRAVDLVQADEVLMHAQTVRGVAASDFLAITPETTFSQLREMYRESEALAHFLVDDKGSLLGCLQPNDIKYALLDPHLNDICRAVDISTPTTVVLHQDMPLDDALKAFRGTSYRFLPVVRHPDDRELVGVVYFRDLLQAHNRALKEAQDETH
ncbi:MAG: chloride channel protein [Minwuia sp.]|nr:chloride channel protein [Minwuia sp.]